jgi:hypothetical protein
MKILEEILLKEKFFSEIVMGTIYPIHYWVFCSLLIFNRLLTNN